MLNLMSSDVCTYAYEEGKVYPSSPNQLINLLQTTAQQTKFWTNTTVSKSYMYIYIDILKMECKINNTMEW